MPKGDLIKCPQCNGTGVIEVVEDGELVYIACGLCRGDKVVPILFDPREEK